MLPICCIDSLRKASRFGSQNIFHKFLWKNLQGFIVKFQHGLLQKCLKSIHMKSLQISMQKFIQVFLSETFHELPKELFHGHRNPPDDWTEYFRVLSKNSSGYFVEICSKISPKFPSWVPPEKTFENLQTLLLIFPQTFLQETSKNTWMIFFIKSKRDSLRNLLTSVGWCECLSFFLMLAYSLTLFSLTDARSSPTFCSRFGIFLRSTHDN